MNTAARASAITIALLVLAVALGVVIWFGLDAPIAVGAGAGLAGGFALALLGGRSLGRAMRTGSRAAMATLIYGGLFLRAALLVAGFFFFVLTGLGNPVGFAVCFLAGVVLAQAVQVMRITRADGAAVG